MPIVFRCQHCSQLMSITRRKAGQQTLCPNCHQQTFIPLSSTAEPPAESPQPDDRNIPTATPSPQPPFPSRSTPAPSSPPAPEHSAPATTPAATPVSDQDFVRQPARQIKPLRPVFSADLEEEPVWTLRAPQTDFEEMDLTPMVDVTFLLLIFFMITASFSVQKSLEIPVPDPDQQGAAQSVQSLEDLQENSILIEIDENNEFLVETERVIDPRELPALLAELSARDSKQEVIITAQEATQHAAVVQAVDAAYEVGLQRIRWTVCSNP